jgi:hypothetical protein
MGYGREGAGPTSGRTLRRDACGPDRRSVALSASLGDLRRAYAAKGIKSDYVFVNERGEPRTRCSAGVLRKH